MKIETVTSITYVLRLTEDELADALVDPTTLQDALRAARSAERQATDTRKNNLYQTAKPKPPATPAKKKPAQASSFLAGSAIPRVLCPRGCGKMIVDTPKGWGVHNAHSHPEAKMETETADRTTRVHNGNTFPLSAHDAA